MQEEWERDWNAQPLNDDATLATTIEVVDCINESCLIRAKRAMLMPNGMCWRCTGLMTTHCRKHDMKEEDEDKGINGNEPLGGDGEDPKIGTERNGYEGAIHPAKGRREMGSQ